MRYFASGRMLRRRTARCRVRSLNLSSPDSCIGALRIVYIVSVQLRVSWLSDGVVRVSFSDTFSIPRQGRRVRVRSRFPCYCVMLQRCLSLGCWATMSSTCSSLEGSLRRFVWRLLLIVTYRRLRICYWFRTRLLCYHVMFQRCLSLGCLATMSSTCSSSEGSLRLFVWRQLLIVSYRRLRTSYWFRTRFSCYHVMLQSCLSLGCLATTAGTCSS